MSASLANIAVTMSSREIAELTGKRHDHVIRDIEKLLDENEIDRPKFGGVYLDAKGEHRKCYNLPKDLTITLVAGYRSDLRLKIVRRWMELEGQPTKRRSSRPRKPAFDVTFQRLLAVAKALPDMSEKQGAVMAARGTEKLTGVNPLELMGISYLDDPDHMIGPVSGHYLEDEKLLLNIADCDNLIKRVKFLYENGRNDDPKIYKIYELYREIIDARGMVPLVEQARQNFLNAWKITKPLLIKREVSAIRKRSNRKVA